MQTQAGGEKTACFHPALQVFLRTVAELVHSCETAHHSFMHASTPFRELHNLAADWLDLKPSMCLEPTTSKPHAEVVLLVFPQGAAESLRSPCGPLQVPLPDCLAKTVVARATVLLRACPKFLRAEVRGGTVVLQFRFTKCFVWPFADSSLRIRMQKVVQNRKHVLIADMRRTRQPFGY